MVNGIQGLRNPGGIFVFILLPNDEMLQTCAGVWSLPEYGGTDTLFIDSIS